MKKNISHILKGSVFILLFSIGPAPAYIYPHNATLILHNTSYVPNTGHNSTGTIGYTVTLENNKTHASTPGGIIEPNDTTPAIIKFSRNNEYPAATISVYNTETPQYHCNIQLGSYQHFEYRMPSFLVARGCVGLEPPTPSGRIKSSKATVYFKISPTKTLKQN